MIARLWWKEARQVWPIWALLVGLGLLWMAVIQWLINPSSPTVKLGLREQAALTTLVYLFLTGAAAFAGERENRTLGMLDALPVDRWRVWLAKTTFAATTTAALGLLLLLAAVAMEDRTSTEGAGLLAFFLLCGFGWSLLWSALLSNALLAAVLGMGSLTLTIIQLNWGLRGTSVDLNSDVLTAWHWLFAAALVVASALILRLGGPPRKNWLESRRRSSSKPIEPRETRVDAYPYITHGSSLTRRLVWQAWRETWPVWWPLALLGAVIPLASAWSAGPSDKGPGILVGILTSLVLGVNVFNAENRRGTQRFLAHHAARPGFVWLIKLAVGLAMASVIWIALYLWMLFLTPASDGHGLAYWLNITPLMVLVQWAMWGVGLILSFFAAGVWCGMVFRRGITAAIVSLVFWIVVCGPPILLASSYLMWPDYMFWVPAAILAVTWAWSGDWLLDRPGIGRWVRLALYSIATAAAMSSAYVAERVWSVPTLDPVDRDRIFQVDRIAAPVPTDENAADLYRGVAASGMGRPAIQYLRQGAWGASPYADWDANAEKLLDWVNRNDENLKTLRNAAAMPFCRFQDPRTMTVFSAYRNELGMVYYFDLALAASSQVRFAQGDLKGSWEDIEALLRMGRQFSAPNPMPVRVFGAQAESIGLFLAARWANDPRLTVDMLEKARDSYRALPPSPSPADELRAAALVLHNTADMPRADLAFELFSIQDARGSDGPLTKLAIDAKTTPWEMARFRRVLDLKMAARIQAAERAPNRINSPRLEEIANGLSIGEGPRAINLSARRLLELDLTTPLGQEHDANAIPRAWVPSDENIVNRRAIDVILSLRLWQAQHGGRLPKSLDELVEADPGVEASLADPHKPSARFGYIRSRGQLLTTLEPFRSDSLAKERAPEPTQGYMILYSAGPDGKADLAPMGYSPRGGDDLVFPIKDEVPPLE